MMASRTLEKTPHRRWKTENDPSPSSTPATTTATTPPTDPNPAAPASNAIASPTDPSSNPTTTNSPTEYGPRPRRPNAPSPRTPCPPSIRESNSIPTCSRRGPTSPNGIDSGACCGTRTTRRRSSIGWWRGRCRTCCPRGSRRTPRRWRRRRRFTGRRRWITGGGVGRTLPRGSRGRNRSTWTITGVTFRRSACFDFRGTRRGCIAYDCFLGRDICC
mmetsp:Transcript_21859/g.45787  ORF Transcript_21859/g.45787 Transcript_21859/m.45787 type:complete len:217 (+) Transcript_21859:222-872(+)